MQTTEQPPQHREAWWGPINIRTVRQGIAIWPLNFHLTLIVEIHLPFGLRFVAQLWRKR